MTLLILILIAVGAGVVVVAPVWREAHRPWDVAEPSGEAEALRQEELVSLEALRDLTLDFKLGNLSEADYRALAAPLQQRAKRVQALRAEHAGQQSAPFPISPDLDRILEDEIRAARRILEGATNGDEGAEAARYCHQCGRAVQPGDRFCASCGTALRPAGNGATRPASVRKPSAVETRTMDASIPTAAVVDPATRHGFDAMPRLRATAKESKTETTATPRRWLWWGAAAAVMIWVAAVVGLYLNERNSQMAQTPLAEFGDPVQTLTVAAGGLFLGTSGGVQLSTDGRTWVGTGLTEGVLAATPLNETGTSWLVATPTGLRRSNDSGATWQSLETDLRFVGLASAPRMGLVRGVTENALYGSEDGGATWTLLSSSLPGPAQALAVGPGLLVLGTDQGVFSSADGGQTWVNRNGLVNGRIASLDVHAVAYDAANNLLYAGTPAGLAFLNLDMPGGWGQRSLEGEVTALALDGEDNQVLWVGTADGRLLRSPDRGVTWR